jgi:predicted Zn-dependent protease
MKDIDPFLEEPFMPRWSVPWWAWILAGVGVILVIAGTVWMLRPQMDERLYARYRKLPEAAFVPPGDAVYQELAAASLLFNQKKYTKALVQFAGDTAQLYKGEVQLFQGICLLELNQMKEAEALFLPLISPQNKLKEEAMWYTALSRLRRHDRKGCREILLDITFQNPRYAQAQSLLQRI